MKLALFRPTVDVESISVTELDAAKAVSLLAKLLEFTGMKHGKNKKLTLSKSASITDLIEKCFLVIVNLPFSFFVCIKNAHKINLLYIISQIKASFLGYIQNIFCCGR